ncbi:MAG: ATP synthase F1 subunit gamma [Cyclobacteriaceae bacterium]|nr:ATP synthase F1 subunit gamma [Cytophagales bacterium]HNP76406.1 ATP synthase F1 subunit gamma [Cyclobacteriaceae bacterium]
MASLKEVKTRISSVTSTQQITKAMKMVAAAKLRKSQERIMQMRPFAQKMTAVVQNLSSGQDTESWYSKVRKQERVAVVVITSDRGLCGSFNSTVVKSVLRLLEEKYSAAYANKKVTIIPIGKKGFEFFGKRQMPMIVDYVELFHGLSYEKASKVGDHLIDAFRKGEFDRIDIVYNQFKNVATQILVTEQFLPVTPPAKAKKQDTDYIFQPNQAEILSGLIPKALKVQLYKAVLDSNASENGARMTAMDKATENAGELIKDLKLMYNRTRQAAITKEILEIVAGAEALKGS